VQFGHAMLRRPRCRAPLLPVTDEEHTWQELDDYIAVLIWDGSPLASLEANLLSSDSGGICEDAPLTVRQVLSRPTSARPVSARPKSARPISAGSSSARRPASAVQQPARPASPSVPRRPASAASARGRRPLASEEVVTATRPNGFCCRDRDLCQRLALQWLDDREMADFRRGQTQESGKFDRLRAHKYQQQRRCNADPSSAPVIVPWQQVCGGSWETAKDLYGKTQQRLQKSSGKESGTRNSWRAERFRGRPASAPIVVSPVALRALSEHPDRGQCLEPPRPFPSSQVQAPTEPSTPPVTPFRRRDPRKRSWTAPDSVPARPVPPPSPPPIRCEWGSPSKGDEEAVSADETDAGP